jgi:hypothetical protein
MPALASDLCVMILQAYTNIVQDVDLLSHLLLVSADVGMV